LGGTCIDGNSGTYMLDESVEQISMTTVDQGPLAPGKQVAVTVRVWCYASSDKLDLYYSTDPTAATPTWTAVATGIACPATRGFFTFNRTFPLHATATGQQAIRANLRFSTTSAACPTGSFDDHDDMVFTVTAPGVAKGTPSKSTPSKMTAKPGTAKVTTQGRRSTR
jgi:hypothetical protein